MHAVTITEKATEALRQALVKGVFAQSDRITEKAACEYLAISRTPVRAALQALAQEGLLAYEPQRHYRIRRFSAKDIADAYSVRAVLEGLACRIVAEAGLAEATEAILRSCIETGDALVADADTAFDHARWREMNVAFHNAILDAAGNETLKSAARHAEKVPLATMSVIADWAATPDYTLMRMAQIDHRYIFECLRTGAGARAEARMREHIAVASDLLVERIEKQQGSSDGG